MSLAGGSSPVTLTGAILRHNSEILPSIVLAQLVMKGTPCVYATTSTLLELKSGHCIKALIHASKAWSAEEIAALPVLSFTKRLSVKTLALPQFM